ncbi:MAG: ABC transporter ATP-binding protein [Coriobacteriia bacterium]|nr:ABC transporter ATP-binding protein [Coriobacteriia bacterium]
MTDQPLLQVTDLKMHFHTRDGVVKAVDGVTFELNRGETIGVVGESGSGKSVSAMTLMRLVPMPPGKIEGGEALFKGKSLLTMSDADMRRVRGNEIAMIFQDPMTSLNPVYRVGKQLAEPLRIHKGVHAKDAEARAVKLLELVGIPHASQRVRDYPHQFSGGMRQRVMIAMALANDPDILIADEPTTALDVTIQAQIIEIMQELQKRTGTAIIMITHDLGVVADMADRILVMYAGRAVEYGTVDDVFYSPMHPYTWGLMDSLPRHDLTEKGELCPIKGQPPSLIHLPGGCTFHPRCPYAQERCRLESPTLRAVIGSHQAACHFAGDSGFTRTEMACAGVSA